MSQDSENDISRRRFLKQAALTAAAATCFGDSLREAVAQARQSGKPLLTAKNINALIPTAAPTGAAKATYQQMINAIKANPVEYFTTNFTVTPAQKTQLENMPKAQIQAALTQALQKQYRPHLAVMPLANPNKPHARAIKFNLGWTPQPGGGKNGWFGTLNFSITKTD